MPLRFPRICRVLRTHQQLHCLVLRILKSFCDIKYTEKRVTCQYLCHTSAGMCHRQRACVTRQRACVTITQQLSINSAISPSFHFYHHRNSPIKCLRYIYISMCYQCAHPVQLLIHAQSLARINRRRRRLRIAFCSNNIISSYKQS